MALFRGLFVAVFLAKGVVDFVQHDVFSGVLAVIVSAAMGIAWVWAIRKPPRQFPSASLTAASARKIDRFEQRKIELEPDGVTVTLSRLLDGGGTYRVMLDGRRIARIAAAETLLISVAPGTHTLCVRVDWMSSALLTFTASAEHNVTFICAKKPSEKVGFAQVTESLKLADAIDLWVV
jgi:hypothetical protein